MKQNIKGALKDLILPDNTSKNKQSSRNISIDISKILPWGGKISGKDIFDSSNNLIARIKGKTIYDWHSDIPIAYTIEHISKERTDVHDYKSKEFLCKIENKHSYKYICNKKGEIIGLISENGHISKY